MDLKIVVTGGFVYTPATPEQLAAYAEQLKDLHGGTCYPRELERQGKLTKEEADRLVREARMRRRQRKKRGTLPKTGT